MKDIDQRRIYINGASQGAGLGIACAALNPDLPCKAAILYPFLSDFQKVFELGADEIAYEGLRYYARWFDPDGSRANEWFTKLGYVDAVHLASRIRCEVLFGTGLADVVCPPITQDAVYNNLTCKKRRESFPGFGHEEIQAFDDMLLTFFDDAPVVPCPVSTPTAEYQTVTFVSDDGATLSARYIRPVGNKRVPTVLMFHDAGRPVRGWHHMTRFVALGYAVFALENRAEADAQTQFADAQAAARAALSLPTTLNLIAWGEGLGSTLAIAAAAKQPQHVVKCAAQNPLCTGTYADCAQYAAQLVCPLLMGTSGMDTIAPPDAQTPSMTRHHAIKSAISTSNTSTSASMRLKTAYWRFSIPWSEQNSIGSRGQTPQSFPHTGTALLPIQPGERSSFFQFSYISKRTCRMISP